MAVGQPQQPGGNSGMDGLIFIGVAIAVVGLSFYMLWKLNKETIIQILLICVQGISYVGQHVNFLFPEKYSQHFQSWAQTLGNADPSLYGWNAASLLIDITAYTLALFLVPYAIRRIWRINRIYVIRKFTRTFNLKMLAEEKAKYHAAIPPILNEDLINVPIHEGPWAIARSPIDYCLEHEMIYREARPRWDTIKGLLGMKASGKPKRTYLRGWDHKKMTWNVKERRRVMPKPSECFLDIAMCDKKLVEQLGPLWTGWENLNVFHRCLLAILLTCFFESPEKARELALRLAKSFKRLDANGKHNPTIDASGIDKIIRKHIGKSRMKQLLMKHAYVSTVMMAMLEMAWERGIFTTSEFIWLKPVDRVLFLTLNQMGGDRPFVEGTAAWAHFMVEKQANRGVKTPCIEGGTESIRQQLLEEEWIAASAPASPQTDMTA